jgi:hypothetical protein
VTDELSKLRELVEKMVHDTVAGEKVGVYTLTLMHLDNCNRCALEALLPALEQRDRELRELCNELTPQEDALLEYEGDNHGDTADAAWNSAAKYFTDKLRAALNPAERR